MCELGRSICQTSMSICQAADLLFLARLMSKEMSVRETGTSQWQTLNLTQSVPPAVVCQQVQKYPPLYQ